MKKYILKFKLRYISLLIFQLCSVSESGMIAEITDEAVLWPVYQDGSTGSLIDPKDPLFNQIINHDFNPSKCKTNCGWAAKAFDELIHDYRNGSGIIDPHDPRYSSPMRVPGDDYRYINQDIADYCKSINKELNLPNFNNMDEFMEYVNRQPDDWRALLSGKWQEPGSVVWNGHYFNVLNSPDGPIIYNPQYPWSPERTHEFLTKLKFICACETNSGTGTVEKPKKYKPFLVPGRKPTVGTWPRLPKIRVP